VASENPAPRTQSPAERPTRAAQLKIRTEPARVKFNVWRWLTAEGSVPPADARHLITTFGVMAAAISGPAGVVLTLHISPKLTTIAIIELALAMAAALLIAACSRIRQEGEPPEPGSPWRRSRPGEPTAGKDVIMTPGGPGAGNGTSG
jgi:hypothetical protein